jgi:GNAT superfamily N-acetyltransferase
MNLMSKRNCQVHPLSKVRSGDFYHLHSSENCCGWCYCVAWWVPTWEGWGDRSAEENRALREYLFGSKQYDGYLLYIDDIPVGWCQVGPRDRLKKLNRQYGLHPNPETWAITCFLIVPQYRRDGYAGYMLGEVLKDLHHRGVHWVEAFPKRGSNLDEHDLWNGPEEMYIRAGFEVIHNDPYRPILRIEY